VVVGDLNRNTNFVRPKHPKPTRSTLGRNYKAIGNIKMRVKFRRIVPRGLSFRDKSYLCTSGIHELGKILHFSGTAKVLACTLTIPANKFHGVCSAFGLGTSIQLYCID
jgi:hypothetical protein